MEYLSYLERPAEPELKLGLYADINDSLSVKLSGEREPLVRLDLVWQL